MLSYIVSYLQPHRQWIDVLKLCTLTSHRAYISPFGNCIQIIRKMVDALGNAPSQSEDS